MPSFSGVPFLKKNQSTPRSSFPFRFRLYAFIEAAARRSFVIRYACVCRDSHTQLPNNRLRPFFVFVRLEVVAFPEYFCTVAVFFMYMVRRGCGTFLPSGWCFSTL